MVFSFFLLLLLRSPYWGCVWARHFLFLTALICCSQPISDFGGQCVGAWYLPVSGPLDFRLVIQVLLGPRMILNACVRRPDLGLTSHPNDAALPHLVTHKATAAQCPGRGLNPGRCRESP